MYRYLKAPPRRVRRLRRGGRISFVLMSIGGLLLFWALWPILSFTAISDEIFSKTIAPIGEAVSTTRVNKSLSPVAVAADSGLTSVDFTNANAWYPSVPQKRVVTPVNSYTLSIPKLKIKDALVRIGADDLSESLIHYGGTGLPGEFGIAVVFGHSTLPQFFSPTNYKSIFSLLPTLEKGDRVFVTYDGVEYVYEIFEMVVVEPTDVSILEQRFDDSYLTLVTCVPPGTYWKRLNVKARLMTLE